MHGYGTGGKVYHSPEVEALVSKLLYEENLDFHLNRLQQTPRPNYLEPRDTFSDPMFAKKFASLKEYEEEHTLKNEKVIQNRLLKVDKDYEVMQDEPNIPGLEGYNKGNTAGTESVLHYEQVVEQREEQCGTLLEIGPLQQGQD